MANLTVARGTGNITSAQIFFDKDNDLFILDSNKAPLVALTAKLRKREVVSPKFSWFEDAYHASFDAINYSTGYADSATSFVVDNASFFTVNDVIHNSRTGEQMLVTSVGASAIGVTRAWGTTAAAAINDNDPLWFVGSAYAEGAASQEGNSTLASEVFNYTQIFRTPFEVTETLNHTQLYTGNDLDTQKRKAAIDHAQALERAFWFGELKEDTSGTHPRRATKGVLRHITTNITDAGGTLTETEFNTFLQSGFRYGGREKWLFAAPNVVSAINYWAQGKLQTKTGDKTYGVQIMQYLSPHGIVNIIPHWMFEGTSVGQMAYGGYAILIDPEAVAYCPLKGRDTRMKTNIQDTDEDSVKGEYITEAGLQLKGEKQCAVLYDVLQYS